MQPKTALWIRTSLFLLLAFPLVLFAYRGPNAPLSAMLVALVLFIATRGLLRSEGSHVGEVGFAPPTYVFQRLAAGFASGCMLFGFLALLIRICLPMEWSLNASIPWAGIAIALVFHLVTNTCEELAFRGYGFSRLCSLIGMWPAQWVIAGISATFHVTSGWSWQMALVHTTAGSLLFALVFLRWRSIPAAIGVHAAWNWTRDLIMSMPAGSVSVLIPVQEDPWGSSEWLVVQVILVGGTLLACAGLTVSLRRTHAAVARANSFW